ncbi:MAG: PKD domain-containing protein [Bacteroidia bacterium]|nr:PKD domain-containing protein [Bacteroidia bacterium]
MRKFYIVVTILFLGYATALAQISQGGAPASFLKANSTLLQTNIPTQTMPFVDVQRLSSEDLINDLNKEIPWRFGENIPVDIDVKTNGVADVLPDGDKLYRVRVYSQGAFSINLTFDNYRLPPGAKLFIYDEQKTHILGAFTDFNNQPDRYFATTLIQGDAIIIEYLEPINVQFAGTLHLSRVTHGYRNVLDFTAKAFGDAGSCNNNVVCPLGVGWENEIRSVCMLVVGGSGFCTGAMVNNTAQDGAPYVLTANHCSTSNDFASWVFWWNWQSATCTNPGTSPAHDQATTSGSVLKARNAGSDFCLVQMNQTPPSAFNVYYAGWNYSATAATSTMCIHHPSGDIKKISSAGAATSATYSGAQCWNVSWTSGVTEPGSSGSPLFDQNHRIIGQLYGGPSACGATPGNLNDYYGQFAVSWNTGTTSATRLVDWLDPGNLNPTVLNGYDPNTPAVALDAKANAVIVPVTSYCAVQNITPTVEIANIGSTNLTSLSVNYNIDGGANLNQNWTGNLATNATAQVTFPQIALTTGSHRFYSSVTSPNGGTDENTANDTLSIQYVVGGTSLPFTEGFENGTFPPNFWSINNPDISTTWASAATSGNGASTASAFIDFFNYNTAGELDDLLSPVIDLTGLTNVSMTFNVAYRRYDNTTNDGLDIYISTDCGATFNPTPVYSKSGTVMATGADMTNAFIPSVASDWRLETVDLTPYVGNNVVLQFQAVNAYGNNLYIDDINIFSVTTPPIADFTQSDTSTCVGAITFTDLSTNSPTSWLWNFGDGNTSNEQNPTYTYTANGTYSVTLSATNQYGSDQIVKTDLIHINLPASPVATDVSRCGAGTVTLTATGSGTLYWYDAATGGNNLGTGTSYTTPSISVTTPYYVENHVQQTSVYGGNTESNVNGIQYNQAQEAWLTFNALTDFKLVSVEVNAGTTASRKISLRNSSGITLDSVILTIPAGVSRITLDFDVPTGTGFRLVGPMNANMYRNNANLAYPYNITGIASITNAGTTQTPSLTTRYYFFYNWEVKLPDCISSRVVANAIITNGVVAGTASASPSSICSGNTSTITLTGSTGNIQWQQSANGTSGWANVTGGTGATTANYTTAALTATTYYRALVYSTGCADEYSNVVSVTVTASPVAGTASANPAAVCLGESSTLTLSGSAGNIQWQDSIAGGTWADVTTGTGGNTSTYTTAGITATTYFRALVSTSNCGTSVSNTATVTLNPSAVGGTVTANNNPVCTGSTVTLTVTGYTGTIRWQKSTDGSIWADITGFTGTFPTYVALNLTQTTWYRTKLTQGSCPDAFSNEVMVVVNLNPVGGTASANPANFCTGNISVISLTGYTGSIQWQQSANGTSGWINVTGGSGETTDQYTTPALSATTYYRTVLSSAGCTNVNSNVVMITVTPGPVGGTAVQDAATVCSGSFTSIVLTGYTGTIQWEESSDGITGWADVAAGSGATTDNYTTDNLTAANYYRARLTFGACPDMYSNVVIISVDPVSVAGTASASAGNVCTLNTVDISLTGYTGAIQWQLSPDGTSGWIDIPGAISDVYTTDPLDVTSYYRAVVTSGICSAVNSNVVSIDVTPGPVGGEATATDTVLCSGETTAINLVNYTGTIQWEQSADGITGWADVTSGTGATSDDYATGNLSVSTFFRARLSFGTCPDMYSNIVMVNVNQPAVGGTAGATPVSFCAGGTSTITLTGYNGNIQWQSSSDGSTGWTDISGANAATYITAPLSATTYFRAVLISGICAIEYSNIITVTVLPTSVAGTATTPASGTICSGTSTSITLTGYTGNIQWQFSANGSTGWANIPGATGSTYNTSNLINNIYYRAVVSLGTCPNHSSNIVLITINQAPVAGTVSVSADTICGSGSVDLTLTGSNGTIQWQESADGSLWSDIPGANTASYTSPVLTATTYFQAVLSSGVCEDVNTAIIVVTVDPQPIAGTASTTTDSICEGSAASITMTGSSGNIQWQVSSDGISGWVNITGANSSVLSGTPQATAFYMAELSSGSCSPVYSNIVEIAVNPAITVTTSSTDATSGNNDGTATVAPSGGNGNFTYIWDNNTGNQTTATATSLYAGTYYVTVSDGYCQYETSVTVNGYQPSPVANFSATPVTGCPGTSITFTDQSTNNPNTWFWIFDGGTPPTSTDQNPTVLYDNTGVFNVTLFVGNAGGSDSLVMDSMIIISGPVLSVTSTDETAPGANDGTASVTVTGGTPPYTYFWSNGANTADVTGLAAGNYSIVVLDANNCMATQPVTINSGTSVGGEKSSGYSVYPNPFSEFLYLEYNIQKQSEMVLEIYNINGRLVYSETEKQNAGTIIVKVDLHQFSQGAYFVKLRAGNTIFIRKIVKTE